MARTRYLKPDFFKDEDLAELPYQLRLFFAGLWCHADKAGRLEDRPVRLKAEIFPYDKGFQADTALDILANIKKHSPNGRSFILRYTVCGERYIQIVSWEKHQHPHYTERESVIPPPPVFVNAQEVEEREDKYKDNTKCSSTDSSVNEPLHNRCLTVIRYNSLNREWLGIAAADMESWATAYPACDLKVEFAKMGEWLAANPAKAVKSNWRRFIVNWLSRAQDRGGSGATGRAGGKPPVDMRVGESPKQEHDAAYWAKVRQRHAE